MNRLSTMLLYVPSYVIALATGGSFFLPITLGIERNTITTIGIAACFLVSLIMYRRGAKLVWLIPALIIASWERLFIVYALLGWFIMGFV